MGSKSKIFGFLNEHSNNKVNGWTVGFLTKKREGSPYKISSIRNANICYIMFSASKDSKLTSIVAHFWWNNNRITKGIY